MKPTYVSMAWRLPVKAVRTVGLLVLWGALPALPWTLLAARADASSPPPHDASVRSAADDVQPTMDQSKQRIAQKHDWPESYEQERNEREDEFDQNRTNESEPDLDRRQDDRNDLNRRGEDQLDLNRGSEADLDLNRPGDDSENDLNR